MRAWCWAVGACVATALGCDKAPSYLEHVEVLLSSGDEPRLITRRWRGLGGHSGNGRQSYHFLYAERAEDGWSRMETVDLGSAIPWWGESRYVLLRDSRDRMIIVASTSEGTVIAAQDDAASWSRWSIDPRLAAEAREAIVEQDAFSSAWIGADDGLRILAGRWLFEGEDQVVRAATDTGFECLARARVFAEPDADGYVPYRCAFDATGDRAGEAAVLDTIRGTPEHPLPIWRLRRMQLGCAGGACTWSTASESGFGEAAGNDETFRVLHTAAGAPVLLRGRFSGSATSNGTSLVFISSAIAAVGATPRPLGGFVGAVVSRYTDELSLTVVEEDLTSRRVELGEIATTGTSIGVAVAPATATTSERAHLLVPMSGSTLAHVAVDLDTGAFERDDLGH